MVNDTHPDIEAVLVEGYRRMSLSEKLERMRTLTVALDTLVLADVKRLNPKADAREQALLVAARRIPRDLMERAFGLKRR